MSNRFDKKFKAVSDEIDNGLLKSGVIDYIDEVEVENQPNLIIDNDIMSNINIEAKAKKSNKTYYLSSSITKELEEVARKNKISSSQLLEEILKNVLKLN